MKKTSIGWLIFAGGFSAACVAIIAWQRYGLLPPVPTLVFVSLWALAAVCVYLARRVKSSRERGGIGLDRSQLDPLTVARYMVVAKASAWTGAICGGGYAGLASFVLSHAGQLEAARSNLLAVVAACLGGVALAAAGVYLEKNCQTPLSFEAAD